MKKALAFLILILALATVSVHASVPTYAATSKGSWHKDKGGVWYQKPNGKRAKNQWININGKRYYLNKKGYRLKAGWRKVKDKYYYFKKDGYVETLQWRSGYWLTNSGARNKNRRAKWTNITGGKTFMETSGKYPKNQWLTINGKKYYFGIDGCMASSEWYNGQWFSKSGSSAYKYKGKWVSTPEGKAFIDASGWQAKSQWLRINEKPYYFDQDGIMAASGWVNGRQFDKTGALVSSNKGKWATDDQGKSFGDTSGWKAKEQWLRIDKKWYYFDEDGYIKTNCFQSGFWINKNGISDHADPFSWVTTDQGLMYQKEDGTRLERTWARIDDADYYFRADGVQAFEFTLPEYEIKPYFINQIKTVVGELEEEEGDAWTTFLVVTDPHGNLNTQHSQNIVRYLLDNTKADKCFILGDFSNLEFKPAQYTAYTDLLLPCSDKIYPAIGNHDRVERTYYSPTSQIRRIYDTFLKDKVEAPDSKLQGFPEKYYYYFDDEERKLRYLVINTSDDETDPYQMTEEQLDWLRNTATVLPDTDWSLITFGHLPIDPKDPYPNKSLRCEEVSTILANTRGSLVGYICGHVHKDQYTFVKNSFYEVVLNCDKNTHTRLVDRSPSEQVITVISVNTETGEVALRRIGYNPSDRLKSYNYLEFPDNEDEIPDDEDE